MSHPIPPRAKHKNTPINFKSVFHLQIKWLNFLTFSRPINLRKYSCWCINEKNNVPETFSISRENAVSEVNGIIAFTPSKLYHWLFWHILLLKLTGGGGGAPPRLARYLIEKLNNIALRVQSYGTSLALWDQLSHLPPDTSERVPPNPSQKSWYSIYLYRGEMGGVSWPRWLVTYLNK